MIEQNHKEVLRRLTNNSFYVKLEFDERIEGEETSERVSLSVPCREIPMSTMLYVLAEITKELGESALTSGSLLGNYLEQLAQVEGSDDDAKAQRNKIFGQLIGALLPTILNTLPRLPHLIGRILGDCIIGATPDDVEALGFAQSMKVLTAILNRIDNAEVKKLVVDFFTALWGKIKR